MKLLDLSHGVVVGVSDETGERLLVEGGYRRVGADEAPAAPPVKRTRTKRGADNGNRDR